MNILISIKKKLKSNSVGRFVFKSYHYLIAVPVAKFYSIKFNLIKTNFIQPCFYSYDDTFEMLINKKKSLVRYGDGEIMWIYGKSRGDFGQENSQLLSKRLKEIILSDQPDVLIGIPDFFGDMPNYDKKHKESRNVHLARDGKKWIPLVSPEKIYADSLITRIYYGHTDTNYISLFTKWKTVWKGKSVIIIEGAQTRFGVGNDLLSEAKVVHRIIAPAENAFSKYDQILKCALKYSDIDLFLVALGPTATVLAYDIALNGIQAIDIGHLDIEYEWYLAGTNSKKPVNGKYVNEAGGASSLELPQDIKTKYENEIIEYCNR